MLAIWNTYRIETVDGGSILDFQSDSLEVAENDVLGRIAILEEQVAELQSTVASQQSRIDRLSSSRTSTTKGVTSTKPARTTTSKPKIEAKVRVENRYVQNKPTLPEQKQVALELLS